MTPKQVVDGAVSTLACFPAIARRLDEHRIVASIERTWPNPPAPLIFWLWVAGNDSFAGAPATRNLLSSLELMLRLLEQGQALSGNWESRIGKLLPPSRRAAGQGHLTDFRATLFELLLAFRLIGENVIVEFQPDTSLACDLKVLLDSNDLVAVEAYAPQKAVDQWFEENVAAPWRSLIMGTESGHASTRIIDTSLDPDAVPHALSNILTDSNFQHQKSRQLSSGQVPTLLAVRAYELIPRLENLPLIQSVDALTAAITEEAWSKLPQQCLGLLFCFIGDVIGESNQVMLLPAPGRNISANLVSYLRNLGVQIPDNV